MLEMVARLIRRFGRDERGAVLILFVLVVLPLLMIVAVVIDFSQSLVVKRQLTAAVDSAALALGTLPQITEPAELKAKADEYILAHYSAADIGTLTASTATRSDNGEEITVTATAVVQTAFMGLAGFDTLTVNVTSTVVRKENKLEVVMVLDNSGSMAGTKIESLKSAANTLVDTLFGQDTESDHVKIGLVPFTGGVNLGVPYSDATWSAWRDATHPAALNYDLFSNLNKGTTPPESTWTVLGTMGTTGTSAARIAAYWKGCLRSRANPYDTEDTVPDSLTPNTLFSAYFNPFRGNDKEAYKNRGGTEQNSNCPDAKVQGLTNVKSTITTAIGAMRAEGNTNIPEGLAWGWRVVSPGVPFTAGAGYDQQDVVKAVIVLSDGENSVSGSFSSYGQGNGQNPQIGPNVNSGLNSKLTTVCNNIKQNFDDDTGDDDIIIYTITFDVHSTTIEALMEGCATDPSKSFKSPTSSSLETAFATIAAGLNQLRIKK